MAGAEWDAVREMVGRCEVDGDLRGKRAFGGVGEGGVDWVVVATDDKERKWPKDDRPEAGRDDAWWC